MNLLDIAKTVGAAAFSVAVPGGGAILAAVNQMLSDDSKLPVTATGNEIKSAVSAMPAELGASVISNEFDVDMTQTIRRAKASIYLPTVRPGVTWSSLASMQGSTP